MASDVTPTENQQTVEAALDAMERMDAQIETNSERGTPDWYLSALIPARAALRDLVAQAELTRELADELRRDAFLTEGWQTPRVERIRDLLARLDGAR